VRACVSLHSELLLLQEITWIVYLVRASMTQVRL
jgi:hypothetical protein